MRLGHVVSVAIVVTTTACARGASDRNLPPVSSPAITSQSLVGRWALVTLIRSGQDQTNRGPASARATAYYTFDLGGTFRIDVADSVRETGRWSVDTTVSPKTFDHVPDGQTLAGAYVPGIYAIDRDTLRISIRPPNAANRHPSRFESLATDSSWLLVFARAPR